jgi:myo-inositol-hexaphosphate 3-phosphohydrolase
VQQQQQQQRAPRRDIVAAATRLQMIADDVSDANREFVRSVREANRHAPDGALVVGKLHVYGDRVLGKGSGGTVVYEGKLDGRRVAVKRLLREFYSMAKQEIELLVAADEQKNVVRYYAHEADAQVIVIGGCCYDSNAHIYTLVCLFGACLCRTNVGRSFCTRSSAIGANRCATHCT